MKRIYTWRDLVGEPQLCKGGRLCSIVFCCDIRQRPCYLFEKALEMIGLTINDYLEILEKKILPEYGKPLKRIDNTAFGNLVFAPSLEEESRDRDEFLLQNKWSPKDYLAYKFAILKTIVPKDKLDLVFRERLLKPLAVNVLDLESQQIYKATALGNLRLGLVVITRLIDNPRILEDLEVKEMLVGSDFVGIRLPKSLTKALDDLVAQGIFKSRSEAIVKAIQLLTSLYSKTPT